MSVGRLTRFGYNLAVHAALPLLAPYYAIRGRRTGKYPLAVVTERLGFAAPPLAGEPGRVWMHAVSVGEVLAARGLLAALRARQVPPLVLSATTAAGLTMARRAAVAGEFAAAVASPLDLPWSVRRAFDRVAPRCIVLVEAEMWPNWLLEAERRRVPVALVNARITERSFVRYRRAAPLFRPLFAGLAAVGARTAGDAERLHALGVRATALTTTGDLKFDVAAPSRSAAELRREFRLPATAPVVIAGSTHPDELQPVLAAVAAARVEWPDLVLVVAPRKSFAVPPGTPPVVRRTMPQPVPPGGILWLDTIGELRDAYGAADVAFVGGSLVPWGGQNLLEPAAAGVPVLFGPHTANFEVAASSLIGAGAGVRVADAAGLGREFGRLLADPGLRQTVGARGRAVVATGQGATARTVDLICDLLAR